MALLDLADPETPLPTQLVLDTSLLLACRAGDDNPHASASASAAKAFVRRLGAEIAAFQMVAWLVTPVLQECYHILLSHSLRLAWESLPPESRPPNWLAAYKQQPELLTNGFPEIANFDEILASIPLTPVQPDDLLSASGRVSIEERIRHFVVAYYLLPQDALILAEAERLGARGVATLDKDWRRVAEFDIYTTPL